MADKDKNSKRNPSRVETGINKRNRKPIALPDAWLEGNDDVDKKGQNKSKRRSSEEIARLYRKDKQPKGSSKPKGMQKSKPRAKPKTKTAPKAKRKGNSPMNFGKAARNRQKSRIYET